MSKTRLVITAVVIQNRPVHEVAAEYGISRSWLYELLARYHTEGEAVFEPRSRRPKNIANATAEEVVELIVELREKLATTGLDCGPDTIKWHLEHHHGVEIARTTISRHLTARGLVVPEPKKRPKSSYIRFEAAMPNERWQSDFTHYRLTRPDGHPGADTEILSWLDDCSRFALSVTAHVRVTGTIVLTTFRASVTIYGIPASTLTDNGMVFTTRLSGGKGGRNGFEHELRRLGVRQINSTPNHPTTCGKVERFQQTLKKWLRAQPVQPSTVEELQALLDRFVETYNHHRPHRSLPHRATPATIYTSRPKATPEQHARADDTHDRVRRDRIDKTGKITLRHSGRLYSIGIGRTHARTRVIVLVQDLNIRIIDAATGELLRQLVLDTTKRYQPIPRPNTSS
ncbi:transposase InsO family protein [Nocardioides massiliensis]|uniref:Transposase InsO family protein n=1 Tax=Nocardioides massiliensis TaxID=1325935 RepID=A0ABT9NQC0_9ACTN|nr:IS481 family transposase [Nocardioides massiliensis]MDP9822467.1 transposase InsO family protein [Nocardioides massiliensis]